MKLFKLSAIVLGILLPLGVAHADIASDLARGVSPLVALQTALASGMSVEDAITQAIAAQPENARLIILAIIAIKPDQMDVIVQAAVDAGVDVRVVTAAAIDAGATPAQVAEVTLYAADGGMVTSLDDEFESFDDSASSNQGPASP